MTADVLDDLVDLSPWHAHRPDGSASTALSIMAGPPRTSASSTLTAQLSAQPGASGHFLDRVIPATDLSAVAGLQLYVNGFAPATPGRASPWFLELRLGSVANPVASAANPWHRLIPVNQAHRWEPVPLSLADLPASVRGRLTTLRLTSLVDTPWSLSLDAILAVNDDMLADADAALVARLDSRLTLGGQPVPAVAVPTAADPPAMPYLRVSNYDVQPDLATSPTGELRTDFTDHGFSLRPPAVVYHVYYAVEAVAAERRSAAALLDFTLGELAPVSTVLSRGRPTRVEWIEAPGTAAPPVAAPPSDHPVLHFRVTTSRSGQGLAQPAVPAFNLLKLEVDQSLPA
jgi:hypothetical protein